ncbi:MAG: hypothetical protein ABI851_03530 [Saprospiraceae bacterium]
MISRFIYTSLLLTAFSAIWAHEPNLPKSAKVEHKSVLRPRENCSPASKQIDQEINNVRARLLNGGDVWWDLSKGRYIVPKIEAGSGKPEVSSLFAGGVWVGGLDPSGALKFMGQPFREGNKNDCWPGPLTDLGEATTETCLNWDRFFSVTGDNIRILRRNWAAKVGNVGSGAELSASEIPDDIKYFPCRGNVNFESHYGFALPNTSAGLALFNDLNFNKVYEPQFGEYPTIDILGCPNDIFPDEMIFWIYNDNGGIHSNSQGDAIRMEVQVQAFGFRTADELNDMTFQRYKLVNRAPQDIDSCYFAMWIDPDLGCYADDYIGCDTSFSGKYDSVTGRRILRDLMYIYNIDAADGNNGCTCDRGVNTYCTDIPILGVDYFRGPVDDSAHELGMTYFMYYNNPSIGQPNANTTDPTTAKEFYNYITGRWKDGTPLTVGGSGYNPGSTSVTRYAFPSPPNDQNGWSMCSASQGEGDRRTIQATGPLKLQPGAKNELIIGVPWVGNQNYPCPNLDELLKADQLCQDLFDNCFRLKDGPDAPNVDFVELDQQLIMILSNVQGSNNYNEVYEEKGLGIPPGFDNLFRFEGYRVFQLANADISLSDKSISDPDQIREIFTVDLKNKIKKVYNWVGVKNPIPSLTHPIVYHPELKVEGLNSGINHTFNITEDAFSLGINRQLANHKKYYFIVVAYSYNNYGDYDVALNSGQRMQYCPGRLNLGPTGDGKPYTATPRPQVYERVNSAYGEGIPITRYDGIGTGDNFLRLADGMYDKILNNSFGGKIEYAEGSAPIEVKIVNPLKVKEGEYEVKFTDSFPDNTKLDIPVKWTLKGVTDPTISINSTGSIDRFSEQVLANLGISVSIGQVEDCGADPLETNGIIGSGLEYTYKDPNGVRWFIGQPDRNNVFLNFVKTELGAFAHNLDPQSLFEVLGTGVEEGSWYPYKLINGDSLEFTPEWLNGLNKTLIQNSKMADLNNVDIVFTSDKSKWTRCMVIETWNSKRAFGGAEVSPFSNVKNFQIKENLPSVGKNDADGDGKADPDGEIDPATGKPLTGMGWFPGYAIDVESGKRLNIFFGENSFYSDNDLIKDCLVDELGTGNDLMWNPTGQINLINGGCGFEQSLLSTVLGGHHYIYATKQDYDSCRLLRAAMLAAKPQTTPTKMTTVIREITWCSMATLLDQNGKLNPLGNGSTGLIPNDLTVSLRVRDPYQYAVGTNENKGHNLYKFKIDGKAPGVVDNKSKFEDVMGDINVVPNPYYGFSSYEATQFQNIVKITNLPAKCKVTIYSIDGKFIKQYKRDEVAKIISDPERGISEKQISADVEWDLTNFKNIPISSGAYLIHIEETSTGAEKIIKWFGVARKFDPSGL